jgi:cytidylate kinase
MLCGVSDRLYVIVDGPPASGKSTLASALAPRLKLPLVAKDTIKDALMTVLDVPDVAASRHVGRAAVVAMLAVAAESPIGAVIESNFHRTVALDELRALPGDVVEVFCRCEPALSIARYRERAGTRAAGHFDDIRTDEEIWNEDVGQPVAGGWPVIETDTSAPVDVGRLVDTIQDVRTEK